MSKGRSYFKKQASNFRVWYLYTRGKNDNYDKQETSLSHWKLCAGNADGISKNLKLPEERSTE